jgi:DNA-directed RNA polymerase subunit delta
LAKKRIVKNYDALSSEVIELIKEKYPTGYAEHLVTYTDQEGKRVSALPFETDEAYYLVRMTIQEAKRLAKDDEDYDDESSTPRGADFADIEIEDQYDGGDDDDDMDSGNEEDDHIIVTRRRGDDEDDIADDTEY